MHFLLDGPPRSREAFFSALDAAIGPSGGGYGAFRIAIEQRLGPRADADFVDYLGKL